MDGGGVQKFFNALQHVDPPEVGLALTVLTVTGQHLMKKKKRKKNYKCTRKSNVHWTRDENLRFLGSSIFYILTSVWVI